MCATYRRPELLAELLYCFLAQDWPNKELVIVQDEAEQQLVCDHPDVRIINWPRRMSSLGLKRNFGVSQCRGDYIFHVDDDDLYLPHKIRQGIENASAMGVFKTDLVILDTDPMELVRGQLPSNYMYTHRSFAMGSGYGIESHWGGDPQLMGILDLFMDRMGDQCLAVEKPSYIYRWKSTPYHNSARPGGAFPSNEEMRRGRIELVPRAPAIDIHNVQYHDAGRSISEVLRFSPANMERFHKGVRENRHQEMEAVS